MKRRGLGRLAALVCLVALSTGCEAPPLGRLQATPFSATALPAATVEPTATRMPPSPTGNSVVVAIPGDPAGFDPYLTVSPSSFEITRCIYDTLVRVDGQGVLQPGLAEQWEVRDDGRTWSFHLKDGVFFHNGRKLTGSDVAYSIERLMEPTAAGQRSSDFGSIASITISDTLTINLHLTEPRSTLARDLANDWAAIVPEEGGDKLYLEPIGTGPFQLEEWEKGNYVTLRRAAPISDSVESLVDEISFRIIPEETGRVGALRAGQVDIVAGLSLSSTVELLHDPEIELVPIPSRQVKVLAFNHAREPFDDVLVRQGIEYGIDRQSLIDAVWPGAAVPSGGELSPSAPFYVDLTRRYPPDIERAKALLGEAGYEHGIDTTLTVPLDEDYLRLAYELARQLGEFGVRAEVVPVDWTVFLNRVYFGRDFELTTMTHRGRLDPIAAFERYTSGSLWNYLNYENPNYDTLVVAATGGDDDIASAVSELQRLLVEDAAAVYLAAPLTTTATRAGVENCMLLPDGGCDLRLIRKEQ